jgi:hypothetical protein
LFVFVLCPHPKTDEWKNFNGGARQGERQGKRTRGWAISVGWVWANERKGEKRTTMWVSIKLETVLKIPSAPLGCSSHQRGKHSEKSL